MSTESTKRVNKFTKNVYTENYIKRKESKNLHKITLFVKIMFHALLQVQMYIGMKMIMLTR